MYPVPYATKHTFFLPLYYDSGRKLRKTVKDAGVLQYTQDYVGRQKNRKPGWILKLDTKIDNIMFKIISFFTAIFCCCISCLKPQIGSSGVFKDNNKYNMKGIAQRWRQDSLGCENFRSKLIAEDLLDSFSLMNKSENEFLQVFGKPNSSNRLASDEVLYIYYFDSKCKSNVLIDTADYCIANFIFKSNKLAYKNFICL
jgi:hypothetical protein